MNRWLLRALRTLANPLIICKGVLLRGIASSLAMTTNYIKRQTLRPQGLSIYKFLIVFYCFPSEGGGGTFFSS
jgi:hypothetical protein